MDEVEYYVVVEDQQGVYTDSFSMFFFFWLLNNLTDEIYTTGMTRKVLVIHPSPFSNTEW